MFDPYDFLKLATELTQSRVTEAKIRTAVGRSYYASFLQAREAAGLSNLMTPEVHREVVRFLYSKDPPAANMLHILRTLRNEADYDLEKTFNLKDAEESLKMAKDIAERL